MKFGLVYSFRNPDQWRISSSTLYGQVMEQIVAAEELGYDSVWFTEHHFLEDGYCPAVLPVCAAVAAKTKRIRIGTWVLLLPLHHPVQVAEDSAVVDIISNGRFTLGLGQGYRTEEFEGYGVNRRERASRLEEGLEVIKRCWTTDTFSFQGKHYDLRNVSMSPKPVQKPHPPIWIGGRTEQATRRIARLGYPLLLMEGRSQYRTYVQALKEYGKEPGDYGVLVSRYLLVSPDPEETWRKVQEHLTYQLNSYRIWARTSADLPSDIPSPGTPELYTAQEIRGRFPNMVCDPDTAIRDIERYHQEVPFEELIFWAHLPGVSPRESFDSVELFARTVIPHFRQKAARAAP